MKSFSPKALIALLLSLLPACSFKLSHPDGSTTYIGTVNIEEGNAGDAPFIHSRRIGLLMDAGSASNAFAIGYDDRLIVKPPNDKLTQIDYDSAAKTVNYHSR